MAKKIQAKAEEVTENVSEEMVVKNKSVYPEVAGTKKFEVVKFEDGYLVYNPDGVRVSGVETKEKAEDIVRSMNISAGLK